MAFREISVEQLKDNPFTLINKDWMLITAGDAEKHNTMTASWGGVGELWGKYVSTIYIRPQRYTLEFVEREEYYSLCFFGPEYRQALSLCGSKSGRDVDKFAGFAWARDINGVPYVTEQCAARFACTVVNEVDLGTHILFVARVDDWAVLDDVPQMTYDYYHAVKKGLTPPKASSYRPPEEKVTGWRCTVCGYIYEGETLPANYKCPICGQGAEVFEKITG